MSISIQTRNGKFVADTRNNGVRGMRLLLDNIDHIEACGDVTALVKLIAGLCEADRKVFAGVTRWYFGKALRTKVLKDGNGSTVSKTEKFTASVDAEGRLARRNELESVARLSFRSAALKEIYAPSADPKEFDRQAYLLAVLKRLGDKGVGIDEFARDLIAAGNK